MEYEVEFMEERSMKFRTVVIYASKVMLIPFAITDLNHKIHKIIRYREVGQLKWIDWTGGSNGAK